MNKKIKITSLFVLGLTNNCALFASHFLSFVMPCYNCDQTVRDSIESIYQQNLTIPFEVICTDDGSTDDTIKILHEYELKYSNFHVIVHENNQGGGAANNTCVAHSQGDLLFRLDSDNILAADSIPPLITLLDSSGCDGAAFQEIRFFIKDISNQKIHKNSCFYKIENNIADLKHALTGQANPLASGNYLYSRASFDKAGGYPTAHGSDTHCFGLKQYMTGAKIAILPNTFYWHFFNEHGYFCREERTGNNRKAVWATLKKYANIFNQKTRSYLEKVDITQVDPWSAMENGELQLKE